MSCFPRLSHVVNSTPFLSLAISIPLLTEPQVVKSKIQRETTQQEADATLYRKMKSVDGENYLQKQTADAKYYNEVRGADGRMYTNKQDAEVGLFKKTKDAEGVYIAQLKQADAAYYTKKKEADGISAMAHAYKELGEAFGGPQGLLQYMMLKENVYEKLALANAKAIHGLEPKITVWQTGDGQADSAAPIRNIMQSLPPLLSTIQEQTGITPPSWFAQMPEKPYTNGIKHEKSLTGPKVNGTD